MSVEYLVNKSLIPDDGSPAILDKWNKNIDYENTSVLIYPDVHYKKGARVVNGMLICSNKYIYPACLGTENCGFTFGKIADGDYDSLLASFENYSRKLKSYDSYHNYSASEIMEKFNYYMQKDMIEKKDLYDFLGIKDFNALKGHLKTIITDEIIERARKTLGSLGGGNHFFEIHQIDEIYGKEEEFKKGDYLFALHSDSIQVGHYIDVLYSNLSEMGKWMGRNLFRKLYWKGKQFVIFGNKKILFPEFKEIIKLTCSNNNLRTIDAHSPLGKDLILAHNVASVFGEMNRWEIINNWSRENNIKIEHVFSHSHDSISVEKANGIPHVIQRNGVQRIGQDKFCFLPSAMGNYSYILRNPYNAQAFFSTNHGTGRVQDKHIAKTIYTQDATLDEMKEKNIKIYLIGKGNLAEQNYKAFKEPTQIITEMENQGLATRYAKTKPIAVIKG